jgi:cobalamin biosynthesis Mg chelatase CobN
MSTKASKVVNKTKTKNVSNNETVEKAVVKSETDEKSKHSKATEKSANNTKITTNNTISNNETNQQQTDSGSIFSSRDQKLLLLAFIAFTLIIWTISPFQAQSNPNDVAQ